MENLPATQQRHRCPPPLLAGLVTCLLALSTSCSKTTETAGQTTEKNSNFYSERESDQSVRSPPHNGQNLGNAQTKGPNNLTVGEGKESTHKTGRKTESGQFDRTRATADGPATPGGGSQAASDVRPTSGESLTGQPGSPINSGPKIDIKEINRMVSLNQLVDAMSVLRTYFVSGGNDPDAHFLFAKIQAARGDLASAVETLDQPVITESKAALPALGQSAEWLIELNRPLEAEKRFRKILQLVPEAQFVHRALAKLLLRSGRAPVAVESLRSLCRAGNMTQNELASLIAVSDAIDVPLLGAVAEARQLATARKYFESSQLLESVIDAPSTPPDVQALYLRVLAESQQEEKLKSRLASQGKSLRGYSEFWTAFGISALNNNDAETAIGSFLESLRIDPSDTRSIQRLRQALKMAERTEWDEALSQAYRVRHNAILKSNEIAAATAFPSDDTPLRSAKLMDELADLLDQSSRPLEAVLWRSFAAQQRKDQTASTRLRNEFKAIAQTEQAFPTGDTLRLGIPSSLSKDAETLLAKLPSVPPQGIAAPTTDPQGTVVWQDPPSKASWTNIASSIGLEHQFHVAESPQRDGFAIYQTIGGGVASTDFDRDGNPDLYFAQGGCDAPNFDASGDHQRAANRLFRSLDRGSQVVDVSDDAGVGSLGYTTGVSAGDWNQDGFDDLIVNRFGSVDVYTNRGDGTFSSQRVFAGGATWLPASLAIGDINHDGFQDIVALSYADRELIWQKPPRDPQGRPTHSIGPSNFDGGENQVILGAPAGWKKASPLRSKEPATGTSLGVIVGPLTESVNQIFIGNDQQNNRLWTFASAPDPPNESAIGRGCAFGNYGTATAAMGIAAADMNQDGRLDIHITNYQSEPVSLYEGTDFGFRDRTVRRGLLRHSIGVLGFGCASVDFDLNGLPDLIVTNGHVDDTTETNDPFEQPMQLFASTGGRYDLVEVEDPSGYWQKMHVGRALARVDFNRDGRDDVVITNLNENSALLLNETKTKNHSVRISLVGTDSPRDPVGARVTVDNGRKQHAWITAGDGFLCRDEPTLTLGVGDQDGPIDVSVTWPSGRKEDFKKLAVDRHWQIAEGSDAFELESYATDLSIDSINN